MVCDDCKTKKCAVCKRYLEFSAGSKEAQQIIYNHLNVPAYIKLLKEAKC